MHAQRPRRPKYPAVEASIKLAEDVGVEQTPMLAVNGHLLPLAGIPYETLKSIISYQAMLDGVSTGATGPADGKHGAAHFGSSKRLFSTVGFRECLGSPI